MSTPSVADPQEQSPLFTTLPLEIRHHIYQQLWLDYGLTQHILALTERSYLLSFPCVLSPEELNRDPGSPATSVSTTSVSTTPADTGDAMDDTDAPNDAGGATDNGEAEQPQPDDDPGDIAAAIQDLSGGEFEWPNDDPWCAHFACFRNCSQKWDHSFSSMFTACYRSNRGGPDLRNSAVLTSFLVCRRMYQEASEDLFSKMRFSFSGINPMDVFIREVPRALVSRIQFVNITSGNMCSLLTDSPVDSRSPAQEVHDKVRESFPKLRELRLSLHPRNAGGPIPKKQDLEPLYALACDLRKFEVFLPTMYKFGSEVGYGNTPDTLQDAPFTVKIVPPGWHENDDCQHFLDR